MIRTKGIYQLILIGILAFPTSALANKIKKLNISPLDGYNTDKRVDR